MLPHAVVEEIARLLTANENLPPEERLSRRAIARKVGCDRRPVDEMARGLRRVRKRADPEVVPVVDVGRCPQCGHRVELPCLACSLRLP